MLRFGMGAFQALVLASAVVYPSCLHAQGPAAAHARGALTARPAAPPSPEDSSGLAPYLALLRRYEAGDYRGAAGAALRLDIGTARRLARLVLEDVDREMVHLKRLKAASPEAPARGVLNQLRRERVRRLKLTLLVHTEAALRASDARARGWQLALAREAVGRLRRLEEDVRVNGPLASEPGPGLVRSDERSSRRAAPGRPDWEAMTLFIRDWYLVVASRLQSLDHPALLKSHVREGLELLRDDPELLLARGSISEGQADLAVIDRSMASEIYASSFLHRWRQFMSAAGGDYQAAARRQPDLYEATLRWGRINAQLGDRDAARRALDEVAASSAPPHLRYLAQLFLGDLAERERQPHRAREAYESALALFPTAQAPMLALSLLCDGDGEPACARRWLSRSLAAAGSGRLDPWWVYQRGQAWLGDQRLAAFRARGLQQ